MTGLRLLDNVSFRRTGIQQPGSGGPTALDQIITPKAVTPRREIGPVLA
jgi:hypothetical protein